MTSLNAASYFHISCNPISHFDWPYVSYFQAMFGEKSGKANKVILN